ncbi:MAG: PD-(D/E)XK nuclease domain-containing protein [Chlamydiales bacterium]
MATVGETSNCWIWRTSPFTDDLLHKGSEGVYHAIFLSLMEAMGIKVQAEEKPNIGRIDLVVEMKKYIYVIEFKFNKTTQEALDRIESKKYK